MITEWGKRKPSLIKATFLGSRASFFAANKLEAIKLIFTSKLRLQGGKE